MGPVPGAGEATDFTDYTDWERCLPAKFNAENGVEKERDAEEAIGCGGRHRPPAHSFGVPRTSRPTGLIKAEVKSGSLTSMSA